MKDCLEDQTIGQRLPLRADAEPAAMSEGADGNVECVGNESAEPRPPESGGDHEAVACDPPQGEIEEMLAGIWREVLQVEQVGRHDSFFALGGNSLALLATIVRIREKTGTEPQVQKVFENATLLTLSNYIVDLQLAQFDPAELASIDIR